MRKGVLKVVGRVGRFPDGSGWTVVGRWRSPDQVSGVLAARAAKGSTRCERRWGVAPSAPKAAMSAKRWSSDRERAPCARFRAISSAGRRPVSLLRVSRSGTWSRVLRAAFNLQVEWQNLTAGARPGGLGPARMPRSGQVTDGRPQRPSGRWGCRKFVKVLDGGLRAR
jgi:hypothetical protein